MIFHYLINMNIHVESQCIFITDLCNIFFVPQDLMDRINSYSQRIAFQRNLLLTGLQHSTSQVFFPMKINSHHWNAAAYTCQEKLWRTVGCEYQMSKYLFFLKKGRFSYFRVSLKRDKYHIYMAQLF